MPVEGRDLVLAATVAAAGGIAAAVAYSYLSAQERQEDRRHSELMAMMMQRSGAQQQTSFATERRQSTETPSPPKRMHSAASHSDLQTLAPRAVPMRVYSPAAPRRQLEKSSGSTEFSHMVPSMEDIVREQEMDSERVAQLTPNDVLLSLQQGNTRFWMGVATRPEMNAMERRAMIMRQFPKAAILGCSDSRVPIEIVFDQGLGDVFAIRVAGNAYGTGVAASIDYAVAHLHVKVVVVLGHEGCGAVRAAQLTEAELANETPPLETWLTTMKSGMSTLGSLDKIRDKRARDREAVITNVRAQLKVLSRNKLVQKEVRRAPHREDSRSQSRAIAFIKVPLLRRRCELTSVPSLRPAHCLFRCAAAAASLTSSLASRTSGQGRSADHRGSFLRDHLGHGRLHGAGGGRVVQRLRIDANRCS